MKSISTISGWDAFVRTAVVVVGEVLLILVVASVLRAAGVDGNVVLVVVVGMTLLAVLGGILLVILWALLPWTLRRTERGLWEGKMKIDQAEVMGLAGLTDRRPWMPKSCRSRGPYGT